MKNTIAKIGKYKNRKGGHIHSILLKKNIIANKYKNRKSNGRQVVKIMIRIHSASIGLIVLSPVTGSPVQRNLTSIHSPFQVGEHPIELPSVMPADPSVQPPVLEI